MVTISRISEKIIERTPFLEEALARGIINYAALAEELKPEIEKELKTEVKSSAVMMALRRISEKLGKELAKQPKLKLKESDITIKSGLFEITVLKSAGIANAVRKLYDFIDFTRGDFLTATYGLYEVTIIANRKHKLKIQKLLKAENSVKEIDNIASLTIKIPMQAVETPGIFYVITKALNWGNINIIEIVSTLTELTFILKEEDVPRAFNIIKELIEEKQ